MRFWVFMIMVLSCSAQMGGNRGPVRGNPWPFAVSHWKLEGANLGSLWMDSIGTNHLSMTNTSCTTNTGKINLGAAFVTNTISYLYTGTGSNITALHRQTNFTVAVWFYPTNRNDARFIVSKRGGTGAEWAMDLNAFATGSNVMNLRWYCNISNSWKILTVTNPLVEPGKWHLAIGWRGQTNWSCRLYSNLAPKGVTTNMYIVGLATNWTPMTIGNGGGRSAGEGFCGQIDEVTIFTNILSTNQMDSIWNYGHGGVGYYVKDNL